MTPTNHKPCYGSMFPIRSPGEDPASAGVALKLEAVAPAGMLSPRFAVRTDLEAWDNCRACPDFEHCYQLSMARLSLQHSPS